MKRLCIAFLLMGLCVVYGCADSTEEGSFEVVFTWADQPPASPEAYHMWGRVEQRDNGTARTIAESDVVPFGFNTPVPLRQVPNGSGYVLVVELLEGPDKSSHPAYYGESESFTLSAGKHTIVAVELALTSTPHVPDGDGDIDSDVEGGMPQGAAVLIPEARCEDTGANCRINTPVVTLSFLAEDATKAMASNDIGFSKGVTELELTTPDPTSGRYQWPDWDVNADLCIPDAEGHNCDGSRTVYLKLYNDDGYASPEVYTVSVTLDTITPALLPGSTVTPNPARADVPVTVVLSISEALPQQPQLKVEPADLIFDLNNREGNTWSFVCSDTSSAREDQRYGFRVSMVDAAGNTASDLVLMDSTGENPARLSIDGTGPAVEDGSLHISRNRVGDAEGHNTFCVSFSVTEALNVLPVVTVGGKDMTAQGSYDPATDLDYTFEYTTTGSEAEGFQSMRVLLIDQAGNEGTAIESNIVEYDFSPPVVSSSRVAPNPAKLSSVITYRMTLDEPLKAGAENPSLIVEASDTGVTRQLGQATVTDVDTDVEYSWSFTAGENDSGTYDTLTLDTMCDELDNCAQTTSENLGSFVIDALVPVVEESLLAPVSGSKVGIGQTVTLLLRLNDIDTLAQGYPKVSLGDIPMECTAAADPWNMSCSYRTDGSEIPHDIPGENQSVVVELLDAAGNASSKGLGTLEFDFNTPDITITKNPDDRPAKSGERLSISVSATDGPDDNNLRLYRVVDEGDDILLQTSHSSTLQWEHMVANNEEDAFSLRAEMTDGAGNEAVPVTMPVAIDGRLPFIETFEVEGPTGVFEPGQAVKLGAGSLFVFRFTVNEQLPDGKIPSVVYDNNLDEPLAMQQQTGNAQWTYIYTATTPQTGQASQYAIVVTLEDRAENRNVERPLNFQIDHVPPELTGLDVSPPSVQPGGSVRVNLVADEALSGAPDIAAAFNGFTVNFTAGGGNEDAISYLYTATVPQEHPEGFYTFSDFIITDVSGNSGPASPGTLSAEPIGFLVDTTSPIVTMETLPVSRFASGMSFDIRFTVDDPKAGVSVRVGGRDAIEKPKEGDVYVYSYTPQSAGETPDVEGLADITVTATDEAGNIGYGRDTVEFDFAPPLVLSSFYTPDPASLDRQITYSVTFDEAINTTAGQSNLTLITDLPNFGEATGTDKSYQWQRNSMVATDEHGDHTVAITRVCDTLGNCADNLDATSILIDSLAPDITDFRACRDDGSDDPCTGLHTLYSAVESYRDMKITFSLSEAADFVQVSLGQENIDCTVENLVGLCRYQVQDAAQGATPRVESSLLSVLTADAVGNSDFASLPLTLDFDPPNLVGTPYFERCDHYEPARLAPNHLWIKSDKDFDDQPDNYGCAYEGAPQNAPVQINFGLSEPVQSATRRVYAQNASDLVIDEAASGEDSNFILAYYTNFNHADGAGNVLADVTDMAGNPATLQVGVLHFDFSKPDPPAVDTPDAVVYHRIPWGSDATDGNPSMTVEGAADAVEGAGTVSLYQPGSLVKLGSDSAGGNGDFNVSMGANLAKVLIGFTDPAGNVSEKVTVRDIQWTATMGYKVPGRIEENPNEFKCAPYYMGKVLLQENDSTLEPSKPEVGRLGVGDNVNISILAEQNWLEITPNIFAPNGRLSHAMAYDIARDKIVMFGGESRDFSLMQDTWEWDGRKKVWTEVTPSSNNPSPRYLHSMVYDSRQGKVLLFGGRGADGCKLQDTWEWDGEKRTWTNVTPSGVKPSARTETAMAYDSLRGKVVLFGGAGENAGTDTWEWDGDTRTWANVSPSGESPSIRHQHVMAYDSDRGKIVLFGGNGSYMMQDTWEWDGVTWLEVTPSGYKPEAYYTLSMVYDSKGKRMVLYEGDDEEENTWEWDGVTRTWANVTPAGDNPSTRAWNRIVYDSRRGRVVLFGGHCFVYLADMWEYNGVTKTWKNITLAGSKPDLTAYTPIAFDSINVDVIALSASNTWKLNGSTGVWADMTSESEFTPNASRNAIAFDNTRGKVVLFGGMTSEGIKQGTWELNVGTYRWEEIVVSGDKPDAMDKPAMIFDTVRGKIVLAGGGSMWEWDGMNQAWSMVSFEGNTPGLGVVNAMAFDSLRGKIVLWEVDCTWELDYATGAWTHFAPLGDKPSERQDFTMVYDMRREKTILFGGQETASGMHWKQDAWEWDGASQSWINRTILGDVPGPRSRHSMVYDSVHGKAIMFGGGSDGGAASDTWEFDGAADKTGAALFEANFAAAQAGTDASLQDMQVNVYTGGSAFSNPGEDGSVLYVWDTHPGAWRQLGVNINAVDDPGLISYETTDPGEIRRLMFGDDLTLNFAMTPAYPNGTGVELSKVSVDYVEAVVKYRLPVQ